MNAPGRTILLVVSLCVNVALIAIIAVGLGRALGHPMPVTGAGLSPQAILREASPDERARIRAVVISHRDGMMRARMAARRARLEAFRTFAAPDFTPDSFGHSLAAVRAADATLESEATAMLGDVVATMTPAERRDVIERQRRRNPPLWRRMFGLPPP